MNNIRRSFFGSTINRVMLAVFSFIILLAGYFIYDIYRKNLKYAEEKMLVQLLAVVNSISVAIDPESLINLTHKYPRKDDILTNSQDSVYNRLHRLLAVHCRINALESPIYVLTFNKPSQKFEFLVTSAENPYFRHTFSQVPEVLKEKYDTGGCITDYQTENGRWLSAFAPVKGVEGETIGVVQADHEFNSFLSKARDKLWKNIIIAVAIILVLSFMLFRFMKKSLGREEEIRKILVEKNREIIGQNEEIRAQHEEIIAQNEKISENNLALEKSKKIIEEKNTLLETTNQLLDQRVQERTKALEESMENLDNFLYRSYHDILGPIATLKGLCGLSKMENLDDISLSYFEKMDNSVDNLKQSIRKVNAVYELKNRHFISEDIKLASLIKKITAKQQYLLQIKTVSLHNHVPSGCHVHTDLFFLDLMLSDIIRNILTFSGNHEIEPISFHIKEAGISEVTLRISDPGSREIFLNSYFRIHEKDAISVNHDLYIFHNALKKLKCRIINYDDPRIGQTMEIIIPNLG